MGKLAVLFAVLTTLMLSFANVTREESAINRTIVNSDYGDKVVSREMAQSAFNIVASQVKKDFENYRGSISDKTYNAAGYEYSAVSGADDNEVVITAKGMLNNHEFEILGKITKVDIRILDTISVDADMNTDKGKTVIEKGVLISGYDTNPDGSAGSSSPVYALLATSDESYKTINSGTAASDIIGKAVNGNSENKSMITEAPKKNLNVLAESIAAYDGDALLTYSGNQKWEGSTTIGSSTNPQVVRVTGNLEMNTNAVGYGILYVNGNLKMKDNAKWYGVVYQYADGGKFEMDGNAEVYGAVVARSIIGEADASGDGTQDRGLIGGHFDVDVYDTPGSVDELYHEHQYDDKYDVTGVNLLSAGCKKPGLCWDQIMGAYTGDEVEISFMNSEFSRGTYLITADGVNYAGSTMENLTLRVDPSKITNFAANFTDLCDLKMTKPNLAQGDSASRDGAFTIRVNAVNAGGNVKEQLYEISVYHHWKEGEGECSNDAGNDDSGDETVVEETGPAPGGPMEFKIKGSSKLYYSASLLKQMNSLVNEFQFDESKFIVTREMETPLRVGRVLALREMNSMTKEEYLQQESAYLDMLKTTTIDLRETSLLQ